MRAVPFRPGRESGVAILAIFALLFGVAAMLFVVGYGGDLLRRSGQEQATADALAAAKEALIGYAASYRDAHPGEVFGYLPCPDLSANDLSGEGAEAVCGAKDVTVIGRLPWKTLGLPPLRDGHGECLWYAVSGSFKNNPKTDLMNWDTNGLIEIMAPDGITFVAGATPRQRAAAVIFSPGPAFAAQDRSPPAGPAVPPEICGGNYSVSRYLDADSVTGIDNANAASTTANALTRFIAALHSDQTAAGNDNFNDRLVFLTPEEIFTGRVNQRSDLPVHLRDPGVGMLRLAAECVVQYGKTNLLSPLDKRLPWAAPLGAAPGGYSNYGTASLYDDNTGRYSGRLPYVVDNSAIATGNIPLLATLVNSALNSVMLQDYAGIPNPCPGWGAKDEFWSNWKDHVFYAVAEAYAPNASVPPSGTLPDCSSKECITVDGVPGFAAVLIFAGEKAGPQSRNNDANPAYTSSEKSFWSPTVAPNSNYLEGINATAIQSNTPAVASPRQFSQFAGNDTVICIQATLTGGLLVDPTCQSGSGCDSDGDALAAYRSGNVNNCRVGKKDVQPDCQTLVDRIEASNCSCEKSAREFIKKQCLDGFTEPKCLDAYNGLAACT